MATLTMTMTVIVMRGDEGDECDDGKDGDHDEDKQWHVYGIGVASESTPQSPV